MYIAVKINCYERSELIFVYMDHDHMQLLQDCHLLCIATVFCCILQLRLVKRSTCHVHFHLVTSFASCLCVLQDDEDEEKKAKKEKAKEKRQKRGQTYPA